MALVTGAEKEKGKTSPLVQAAALIVMTALAIGIGWYAGEYLQARQTGSEEAEKSEEDTKPGEVTTLSSPNMVSLEPITTNLAEPSNVWVRLELALVFPEKPSAALAQAVHQDLLAYMRTVKLRQIESASGFQHLKSDLRERARIRSDGRVEDVLISTLLYE